MFFNKKAVIVILFALLIFLISSLAFADVVINEIMYDPDQCNGDVCEWVELYNDGNEEVDLTDWTLCDDELLVGYINCNDNELYCVEDLVLGSGEYALITDGDSGTDVYNYFPVDENSLALHVDSGTICSYGLNNNGENIYLKNESGDEVYNVDYEPLVETPDHTLERREDNTWGESLYTNGTPGWENSIFSFSQDYSDIIITEILPNPEGDDDANKPSGEWVELYNTGAAPIDLKELCLTDQDYENELYIAENKVISENDTVIYPYEYKTIYRDGDSDFALNNNGYDEVKLYHEEELIDELSYSGSTEQMSWSWYDDDWFLTLPTPGAGNDYQEGCDWELNIGLENNIFQGEDLDFDLIVNRIDGPATTVTVRGQIENIFGEIDTEYSPWTDQDIETQNTKSYSPNLAEGTYQISFWIEDLSCVDYDESNNVVYSLIAINPEYQENESYMSIEEIYLGSDDSAEWGDQFTVKVNIYKGEDTKYSIQLYAKMDDETISKRSKLNIYDEYQDYTVTLPVQLEPNCDGKIEDGMATLYLEGLGLEVNSDFEIEDIDEEVCTDYLDYVDEMGLGDTSDGSLEIETYSIVNLPTSVTVGDVLEVTLQIMGDDEEHDYQSWAYLYNGPSCLSCYNDTVDRNYTLQEFELEENELKQTSFLLKLDSDIKEGEYNVKVKLLKDDQVTEKEVTESIYVFSLGDFEEGSSIGDLELYSESEFESSGSGYVTRESSLEPKDAVYFDGIIIYESSAKKAQKLVPYFLTFAILLLAFIIWKRVK